MSNSAGTGASYPDFTLFEASVALTESGLENWEQVVSLIYAQVRLFSLGIFDSRVSFESACKQVTLQACLRMNF